MVDRSTEPLTLQARAVKGQEQLLQDIRAELRKISALLIVIGLFAVVGIILTCILASVFCSYLQTVLPVT
jgi:hypothetical protein